MSSETVNIRCSAKNCRRLLRAVSEWPEPTSGLWTDETRGVWTEACRSHRAIRGKETIAEAHARREEQGLPDLERNALMVFVSWAALRPKQLEATHRGRPVDLLAP